MDLEPTADAAPLSADAAPLSADAAPPAGFERIDAAPFPLLRASLPSGLTLWFAPKAGATSVFAELVFQAGGRYEDEATSGASHMLEHMLFVGTERWTQAEVRAVIDRAGGVHNGFTGQEQVGYWARLPAGECATALDWLDQIAFHPTLPADEFDREREVVFEERGGHDPWLIRTLHDFGVPMSLSEARGRAIFPGSSRSRPQIGDEASLDALSIDQLRAFYAAHYTAENADLVVVGDERPADVLALAITTFEGLPHGARHQPPMDYGPPELGGRDSSWSPQISDRCVVSLGARGPALDAPDAAAADVLARYLDRVLEHDLRETRGITYGVSAWNYTLSDGGEFTVTVETDCSHKDEVADAVDALIDATAAGTVDAPRFEEARSSRAGGDALKLEGPTAWGDFVEERTTLAGPFARPVTPARVAAVTSDDMVTVAQTWLKPNQRRIWFSRAALTVTQAWIVGLGLGVPLAGWLGRRFWRWRRSRRG
ncbi:peptidase M16 [Deltaproteobacteria bacterium]|nr:peptidase M16 [Deltaproteobacteria bacterium]